MRPLRTFCFALTMATRMPPRSRTASSPSR